MAAEGEVDVARLLRTWGLSSAVIKKFVDEEVTVETLPYMRDSTFAELIPKKGQLDAFIHHWTAWKAAKQDGEVAVSDHELFSDEETGPPSKRAKRDTSCKAFLEAVLARPAVNDLHKFLKTTPNGLIVLGYFEKNSELDNFTRDLMGQQAIYKALQGNYERSIGRPEFSKIADSILELVPSESKKTWYDEVQKGKSNVLEGRLRSKFYSVRRTLYKSNLISRKTLERDLDIEATEELLFDITELDEIASLNHDNTPWQSIKTSWEETRELRSKFRRVVSINQYITKFPFLQNNLGWSLIAEDGVLAQPSLEFIENFWEEYSEFLISLIRKKTPSFLKNPRSSRKSLLSGGEAQNADFRFLSIIRKIPDLFKVRTLPKSPDASKSDKKCMRPSMQEIKDAFCLHVTDIALLDEKLTQRREKLLRYKYTLQPIPVVVGSDKITQCFIVLDEHRWEVPSPAAALWGVFKLCFGLNASYPVEARHVFLFLQQTMLKLTLPKDHDGDKGLRSFLAARIKDYESFLQKID